MKDRRGGLAAAALVLFAGAAGAGGVARGEVDGRRRGRIGFVRTIFGGRFRPRDRGEEDFPDGALLDGVADGESVALVAGARPIGAVELALKLGLPGAELAEVGALGEELVEGFDLALDGREVRVRGEHLLDLGGDQELLVGACAAEAPLGVGHFAEAALGGEAGGWEGGLELVEEGLVFGGVVAGEEHGLGAEAVAEGVAG